MSDILRQRLRTNRRFGPGERIMLALAVATADIGAFPERIFRRHGLTHTRYNVLRMLRGAGRNGLVHGQVAERLVTGMPDVTRTMDRLVEDGLVERERDEDDRRRVVHRITSEGLALVEEIEPELERFHDWLAAALDPEARRGLVSACERLIELARTDAPGEDPA